MKDYRIKLMSTIYTAFPIWTWLNQENKLENIMIVDYMYDWI